MKSNSISGKKTSLKAKLLLLLMALVCLLLWVSRHVKFPQIVWYIGLAILGLLSIALGINNIRTKSAREVIGEDNYVYRSYSGFPAVLSGIVSILFGILLLVISWSLTFGNGDAIWALLKQRPGIGLLPLSLLLIAWGGQSFAGAHEESPRRSLGLFLASIPARLFGLFLMLFGLAAGVLTVLDFSSPEILQQIWQSVKVFQPVR